MGSHNYWRVVASFFTIFTTYFSHKNLNKGIIATLLTAAVLNGTD